MAKSSPEKKSTVILTHVIPTLGNIQVKLFEPAASIYRVFADREISRLRNLLQLGQLSQIHSGAHHTRWDYIMLKLYLLSKFHHCPGIGLASEVPVLSLDSGTKAIQAYSLLRNFGHLDGCFETERVVLEACINNSHAKKMLLRLVPTDFKSWAAELIADEKIFQFYQLLSVIFIEHSPEFDEHSELKEKCLRIMHKFLIKGDNRIEILKDRHRKIRTLAYLALDMHYAPVGLEFNLGSILVAAEEFGPKIFRSSTSGFKYLSTHIMNYVTDTIYTSPDATWAFAEFHRRAYRRILNRLKRPKNTNTYFNYLTELKTKAPNYNPRERPVYMKLVFPQRFRPLNTNQLKKPITKTKELASQLKISIKTDIGMVSSPTGEIKHSYIYFSEEAMHRSGEISRRYKALSEELATISEADTKFNRKQKWPEYILSRHLTESLDSLFRSILYLITNNQYEIMLERNGIPVWISGICCSSRPKAEERVQKIIKSGLLKNLSSERMAELECVLPTIRKTSRGTIIACFSNIKILRKAKLRETGQEYEAAEIDSAVIVANAWHTKLIIIESKNQRSSSAASARKQLQELIDRKIIMAEPFKSGIEDIEEIPNKGAFLPIRLP